MKTTQTRTHAGEARAPRTCKINKVLAWVIFLAICAVGMWLGIMIVGEETQEVACNKAAMSLFWDAKFAALLGAYGLYKLAEAAHCADMFPDWWYREWYNANDKA